MTTATFNRTASFSGSSHQAKRAPNLSLGDFFDVFASSLAMARAVPDFGRINVNDLAKVRSIAKAI